MSTDTDKKNWLDDEDVQNKVKAMKRPPFEFASEQCFDEAVLNLIECLENKDTFHLPTCEDDVHSAARHLDSHAICEWAIRYYGYGGWLDD